MPRVTVDVDLALLAGFGNEDEFIEPLLAALQFEHSAIERASVFTFAAGVDLRTCSAEDLIVFKLFASRPLDVRDAEGVVTRQQGVCVVYCGDRRCPSRACKELIYDSAF